MDLLATKVTVDEQRKHEDYLMSSIRRDNNKQNSKVNYIFRVPLRGNV